jgi:hypothetical protein
MTKWHGSPSDETVKTKASRHSRCGIIKIPSCSKAISAKHGPKFCCPSLAMLMSPYQEKNSQAEYKTVCIYSEIITILRSRRWEDKEKYILENVKNVTYDPIIT